MSLPGHFDTNLVAHIRRVLGPKEFIVYSFLSGSASHFDFYYTV